MPSPVPFDDDLIRTAFDLSPSGMLAVDEGGRVVAVNRETERLFGWTRDELIGRPIDDLIPGRFRAVHPAHRAGYMADPRSRPMGAGRELHGLRRDGAEFPVEIGLNPVRAGGRLFVLATVVDITERRRLEEHQRRSQKLEAIGTLAGGIAHDFNNILLSIVGHAELAMRDPGLGPESRNDLGRVLKGAERGRELVRRILLFSRNTEIVRAPLRMDRVVNEAIKLLRASLPSTIEIRPRLDPATPPVMSDETQVHQILMNLFTNSAHAMPEGGTITIEVEPFDATESFTRNHPGMQPGLHARVAVQDTGRGMTEEVLEHALEPFFTTKPPGEGTGLGLSIIHGIVQAHHGALRIESVPGRGTTVTLILPADETPAPVPAAGAAAHPPEHRTRILYVEDEEVLARMQRRQLEYLGYDVAMHTSSVAALEDFRSRPDAFDLVITDETMPHMTGTALTREILRIRPDLPVLMVSGGDRGEGRGDGRAGIRKVLGKPHTSKELDQAIREVLGPAQPPAIEGS